MFTHVLLLQSVLGEVLEQTVNCKDPIAQEYLMECIIQVNINTSIEPTINEHYLCISAARNNINANY